MSNRKPIRVFYSQLSGRFYATSHYKETVKDDVSQFVVTGKKYDVTDDIAFIEEEYGAEAFTEAYKVAESEAQT